MLRVFGVMKVKVKTRFGSRRDAIEKFGNDRYLAYLSFEDGEDSTFLLSGMLSKYLGVHPNKVIFVGKDSFQDWVFEVQ